MTRWFWILLSVISALAAWSPVTARAMESDTLSLSLADADARFVASNLQLLAQKFAVSASRAAEVQAGLWDNPTITLMTALYNPGTNRYLDVWDKSSESSIQLQQLFLLAGKREKRVALAGINTAIAELQLLDMMRSLKYALHTAFIDLYFLTETLAVYDSGIASLRTMVASYEAVYRKGAITLQELLRLKSLLLALESERADVVTQIVDRQGGLRTLLRLDRAVVIAPRMPDPAAMDRAARALSLDDLLAAAEQRRPDIRIAVRAVEYEQTNLTLQKALAIPDIAVQGYFDRNGNAWPNFAGVQVQIDLPLFNRNQGGIRMSELTAEGDKLQLEQVRLKARQEVQNALEKFRNASRLVDEYAGDFAGDFQRFITGYVQLYERHTIGVLEFTDMFQSYKDSMIQLNQMRNRRMDAYEEILFTSGYPASTTD